MNAIFITPQELAKRVKVCRRTLGRWMSNGLPYYVLGYRCVRFRLSEVQEWLERNFPRR